ncbi:hypothetical protein VP1G_07602 [Cytospora mali]|uniref:Glutaredoxin-like protein n=1 Tax=Cytospora mali TaxID=578113 RepID=A0A194V956_CYTMA|nr:hypothetical protein VP1G_07602 [Valsa mali var. pyri (nom. inval.)]
MGTSKELSAWHLVLPQEWNQAELVQDKLSQFIKMRITSRLYQQSCRITLFTRKHCGLCIAARSVLSDVWDSRQFEFKEVDIVKPESQAWKDLYDFDVPVIHINKASAPEEDPQHATKARKLMHRFNPEQVKAQMDEAEKD